MDGRNETEKIDSDFAAESFYVVMTDHKAKANLEKGSSWPPEAIPYGDSFCVTFYYPKTPNLHFGSDLEGLWDQRLRYQSIIKKGFKMVV